MRTRPLFLQTRWIVGHLIIVVVVIVMANLSLWQLRRLHHAEHLNAAAHAAMNAPPVDLSAQNESSLPTYQHVRVSGSWDAPDTYLLRYPIYLGAEGYWVIEPVDTVDPGTGASTGRVWVNRGWISLDAGKAMTKPTDADGGSVQIVGLLQKKQTAHDPSGTNGAQPSVLTQTAITQPWVQLVSPVAKGDPVPLDPPDLSNGSHYAYTLQWLSFCLITILGWISVVHKATKEQPSPPS